MSTPPHPRADPLAQRIDCLCLVLESEAEAADAGGAVTPASWLALHQSRILLAPFPKHLGGEDLGSVDTVDRLATLLRRLGAADLSVARITEGHLNAVLLLRHYGTSDQVARLAEAIGAGGLSGVWGAEGSPPLRLVDRPGGWLMQGRKALASGAGMVTHPLVPVTTEAGQRLVMPTLVPGERVDLSAWTPQGMRASATGTVDFTGLVVPHEAMIGALGDFMRQPVFSGGAWRFCAVHLGAAERLVDLLRQHLAARDRAGDPYQLQRMAQATVAVTTARFWIERAAAMLASETAAPEAIVAFANLTRTVTERAALDVLELVHRGVGLHAFVRPHPVERISRDLGTYLRQPVPDLAMADAARFVVASPDRTASLWTADP